MAGEIPNFWSKLENDGDVTVPQLGTGGAVIGAPTYTAAKFNNGIWGEGIGDYCTFPTVANGINIDKGTIEFWAKMKYDLTTGTQTFFDFSSPAPTIGIRFSVQGLGLPIENRIIAMLAHPDGEIILNFHPWDWEIDELVHFAVVWDRQGNDIGGGKTFCVYINGVLRGSTITTWNTSSNFHPIIYVCTSRRTPRNKALAVIDNLKTYDVCKTDFSDKEIEGEEPPPGVKTLVQATLISAIPLIAIPTLGQIIKFAGG